MPLVSKWLLRLLAPVWLAQAAPDQSWTLGSGGIEYRLAERAGRVALEYFGPIGGAAWPALPPPGIRHDLAGLAEGQSLAPADLEILSAEHAGTTLRLALRHRRLPLRIEGHYAAWGDTGVFTRQLTLANEGDRTLHMERLPSVAWSLPPGDYELSYLWGGWGQERQLATERLAAGERSFNSSRGRSTSLYSPWFALRNLKLGTMYMAQLAWSGNWRMSFERQPGRAHAAIQASALEASLGMTFDFGGPLALAPGQRFELPRVAFTASGGDLDDAANRLHRYQRQFVIPRSATNDPLLVQFNSWYPFPGRMTVAEMKRSADIAASLGAEVFVLDAGWYNKKNWSAELGDYQPDPAAFPNGLQELAEHVRSRGLKFGLWVEIENLGIESELFRRHPEWCLTYNGKPLERGPRRHLDFSKPEVRKWARAVVDRLVRDYGLGWIKIDYNLDIGDQFDPPGRERTGDVFYRHLRSYYSWLDEVRAAWPKLVVENCSSGGLRFDLGILEHTHTTWLSDVVEPAPSLQLGYGCTVEFAPEVCNHWMVGETSKGEVKLPSPPGWWDFMFRVPMNGQFGISSRVFDWSPELVERARANVALYKRLRRVIMGADVYHLTPPPAHRDPQGWMALQYVAPARDRSVLTAYRLGRSSGQEVFGLRGLDPGAQYRVTLDGQPLGQRSGRELAEPGLPVRLDAEWRAQVIELEALRQSRLPRGASPAATAENKRWIASRNRRAWRR